MKPTKVIKKYQITYTEHDVPITQQKYLIKHEDMLNIINPIQDVISTLEKENKYKPTKESKQLKSLLVDMFGGMWFTDESPLGRAMKTGKLELAAHMGGTHNVQFKKIKE